MSKNDGKGMAKDAAPVKLPTRDMEGGAPVKAPPPPPPPPPTKK